MGVLEKTEKRSSNEIIKDVTTTLIDRLEIRGISEITEDGKIPLEYAVECVEGLKKRLVPYHDKGYGFGDFLHSL